MFGQQQRQSQIINLAWLKHHFHACFSTVNSRSSLTEHLQGQGVDEEDALKTVDAVAFGLSSQLFDTLPLNDEKYFATTNCMAGWARTVETMLLDSALHAKLVKAKQLLENEGVKFYPSVVLESLDALLYDIEIRWGTSFGSACTCSQIAGLSS